MGDDSYGITLQLDVGASVARPDDFTATQLNPCWNTPPG